MQINHINATSLLPASLSATPEIAKLVSPYRHDEVQSAIDAMFDLRVIALRIALYGTMLYRPDPQQVEQDAQDNYPIFVAQVTMIAGITALLREGKPYEFITGQMCDWMSALAHERRDELTRVSNLNDASQDLLDAVENNKPSLGHLLVEHKRVARAGFHESVMLLCQHMWASYNMQRDTELAQAQVANTALQERLSRLERIGTHVRLVSLNASVEAARAGDAGRGLSLIAQEFKGLAEEVQLIAKEARDDVADIIHD